MMRVMLAENWIKGVEVGFDVRFFVSKTRR